MSAPFRHVHKDEAEVVAMMTQQAVEIQSKPAKQVTNPGSGLSQLGMFNTNTRAQVQPDGVAPSSNQKFNPKN